MIANFILFGMPSIGTVVLIVAAILLLFGGKKIPELMRGLGGGIKEFKEASKDDESKKDEKPNLDA
jgi:sec-independent protein translocase protein TatA